MSSLLRRLSSVANSKIGLQPPLLHRMFITLCYGDRWRRRHSGVGNQLSRIQMQVWARGRFRFQVAGGRGAERKVLANYRQQFCAKQSFHEMVPKCKLPESSATRIFWQNHVPRVGSLRLRLLLLLQVPRTLPRSHRMLFDPRMGESQVWRLRGKNLDPAQHQILPEMPSEHSEERRLHAHHLQMQVRILLGVYGSVDSETQLRIS